MFRVRTHLRRLRQQRELTQGELSSRAGISRQAVGALESGGSTPSTAVALRLARTLGCRVEDIFSLDDETGGLSGEVAREFGAAGGFRPKRRQPARVALGYVEEKWVAHPLPPGVPGELACAADGLVSSGQIEARSPGRPATISPLADVATLRENVLVAGCDPGLAILSAQHARRFPAQRLTWLNASSGAALDALARGHVHVAGSHLFDEEEEEFNIPFVRRLFGGRPMLVVNFARWEQGFVVRPGNPRRIRKVEDLARPGVRLVQREKGAGARNLLERVLRKVRVKPAEVTTLGEVARSHVAVAQAVAMGVADVGVATRAAALSFGLGFVALAQERFDLVFPAAHAGDARIARLFDTLSTRSFRRELTSLGGYDVSTSGVSVSGAGGR
jgi:molybdopterin molybdotransferase/putative molybdopterin biosynthesis protein